MNRTLWTLAAKNLARRPRRTLLSMTAVGLAALTMTLLLSLVAGLKADLGTNLRRFTTGDVLVEDRGAAKAGPRSLSLALQGIDVWGPALRALPGVASWSPRVTTVGSVFVDGEAVIFPLMGLDFAQDPLDPGRDLVPGGRLPGAGAREALVSVGLAEKLHLAVGQRLTVVARTQRGSSNGMTLEVTGIVNPPLATYQTPWLFTDVGVARRLVQLGDGATSVLVRAVPGTDLKALAPRIEAVLRAGGQESAIARPWDSASSTYALMDMAQAIYAFISLIFAALASTVIINTMLMVVLERQKEIGMLGALGMDQKSLRRLFLAEGALLAGGGAALGTLAGSLLAVVLGITGVDYSAAMKGVSLDMSSILRPVLEPWVPPTVFGLALGVALLFTLVPVGRLKKMPIVDALRGEA